MVDLLDKLRNSSSVLSGYVHKWRPVGQTMAYFAYGIIYYAAFEYVKCYVINPSMCECVDLEFDCAWWCVGNFYTYMNVNKLFWEGCKLLVQEKKIAAGI